VSLSWTPFIAFRARVNRLLRVPGNKTRDVNVSDLNLGVVQMYSACASIFFGPAKSTSSPKIFTVKAQCC